MLSQGHSTLPLGGLPTILVIAVSVLVAIAILAWLAHSIACRAIDKATPDSVAPVLLALSALMGALRLFLPWSRLRDPIQPLGDITHLPQEDNDRDQDLPGGDR